MSRGRPGTGRPPTPTSPSFPTLPRPKTEDVRWGSRSHQRTPRPAPRTPHVQPTREGLPDPSPKPETTESQWFSGGRLLGQGRNLQEHSVRPGPTAGRSRRTRTLFPVRSYPGPDPRGWGPGGPGEGTTKRPPSRLYLRKTQGLHPRGGSGRRRHGIWTRGLLPGTGCPAHHRGP